eukprot:8948346-Heterocapsa_arctica.AAC.1
MVLPPGPLTFPLKEAWNRANLTLDGKRAVEHEPVSDILGIFAGEAAAESGSPRGTEDAAAQKLAEDAFDLKGGLGIEKNQYGVRCRRDTAGKLYPIDKYGKKIAS